MADELQGLYSQRIRMSYRKISWSREAARLDVVMIVSLWDLISIWAAATEVPVKIRSEWKILNPNLAASSLYEIFQ